MIGVPIQLLRTTIKCWVPITQTMPSNIVAKIVGYSSAEVTARPIEFTWQKHCSIFCLSIHVEESLWLLSRSPFPKSWVMKEARSVVASLGLKMSSLRPVTQDCYLPHRGLHPVRPHPQHTTNRNNFIQMYSRAPPLQQHHKLIELPRQPHFAYPALSGPERSSL